MEDWGFQLLNRGDAYFVKADKVRSAGPLYTLGKQVSWCCPKSSRLFSSSQWEIWHSCTLMGECALPTVEYSEECWTSVLLGRQASWNLQSSGLPLSGGARIPNLGQNECTLLKAFEEGSAGSLNTLGKKAFWCCPLSSRLQLSSPQWDLWHSCSLTKEKGLLWFSTVASFGPFCA
jgi:hypothetical protein